MKMANFIFLSAVFISASFVYGSDIRRTEGICPWWTPVSSNPPIANFSCFNGKIINRTLFCNGRDDCGDNTDENYCKKISQLFESNCFSSWKACDDRSSYSRCIPAAWVCDGTSDCPNGSDERNCSVKVSAEIDRNNRTLSASLNWMYRQRKNDSATEVWGPLVDKSAVVLYFSDAKFTEVNNGIRKQIAYEVSIKLLSMIYRKKLQDIPSTDLASFVNAFLVSCLNPRKFHGLDIVQELRNRAGRQNYTNPYVYQALCNAGEIITEPDKMKLIDTFWRRRRTFWTDIQAVAVMALACASQQPGNDVDVETLRNLTIELKRHQHKNGSVETLQTTGLVMQALLAAEPDDDPDNFDEKKAVEHMYQNQKPDGSFGSLMNTYFVLPVLSCRSLINISSDHCPSVSGDETSALQDLVKQSDPKIRVRYSLWIGNGWDLERNLALRVPANMSFYEIMGIAAELDPKFRFEYAVKNRLPYIKVISGIQDNPEEELYWFLYSVKDGKPTLIESSPAQVIPKNNDHLIMWYRSGSWVE